MSQKKSKKFWRRTPQKPKESIEEDWEVIDGPQEDDWIKLDTVSEVSILRNFNLTKINIKASRIPHRLTSSCH